MKEAKEKRRVIGMRKMLLTPLIACMAALLSMVWMPAVSATILESNFTMRYNIYPEPGPNHPGVYGYWKGEVTGDTTGTCYFWETEKNYIVGKVEHFFEEFYIDLGNGWISGQDTGVWNFATFKFRAYGWITAASENHADMIGNFFFEEGFTTDPNAGLPIIGTGTCFFGP